MAGRNGISIRNCAAMLLIAFWMGPLTLAEENPNEQETETPVASYRLIVRVGAIEQSALQKALTGFPVDEGTGEQDHPKRVEIADLLASPDTVCLVPASEFDEFFTILEETGNLQNSERLAGLAQAGTPAKMSKVLSPKRDGFSIFGGKKDIRCSTEAEAMITSSDAYSIQLEVSVEQALEKIQPKSLFTSNMPGPVTRKRVATSLELAWDEAAVWRLTRTDRESGQKITWLVAVTAEPNKESRE